MRKRGITVNVDVDENENELFIFRECPLSMCFFGLYITECVFVEISSFHFVA